MRCVLGFDGGGTKTECVLMDEARLVVARSRSGPSNPLRVGIPAAAAALEDAAQKVLADVHLERREILALCAGLAGAAQPDVVDEMHTALASIFPSIAIEVCTDLYLALAATGEGPAIVLVAGTGSAAIGRDAAGNIARAGGYGPQVSDEGSAFDIGKHAISAALRERDRTGVESSFGKQILRQLGASGWTQVHERLHSAADTVLPRIFPVVAAAADAGDEVARAILRDAASDLVIHVATLAERLGFASTPFVLTKTGGTLGRSLFFDAEIDRRLQEAVPHARISELATSPAEAAAHLALRLIATPHDSEEGVPHI